MVSQLAREAIVDSLNCSHLKGRALRLEAMESISRLPGYAWTGVYRLEGKELVLDEFVGAYTDHLRIAVGMGVCGTAVAQNSNQIVDDVSESDNYLACSLDTRSEIVVLIRREEEILGQIDVDSHQLAAFTSVDETFLTQVAAVIACRWED